VVVEAAPESHLRFLAGQVLVRDGPGDEFIVASASLAAVANAYVMLGLLTEPEAEAALNATANANRDLRRAPVHPRCCCHRGPVRVGSGHSAAPVRLALGAPERWPAAIPSFMVSAIDDLGAKHEGRPGSWSGYGEGEGHGDFTLWPAVPARVNKLHVVVSTLWEPAWADIELPRGLARLGRPRPGSGYQHDGLLR
jgi:hypothetical protein